MSGTLRDDLLAIPGIEGAELDGDADSPSGVRVRLGSGADAAEVSRLVQQVLSTHGMRSQLTPPETEPVAPPPPPGAPAPVVALPTSADASPSTEAELLPAPDDVDRLADAERVEAGSGPGAGDASGAGSAAAVATVPGESAVIDLDSVAVEEGRSGVVVRITTTAGLAVAQKAPPIAGGVDQAIVAGLAELTNHRSLRLVGVQETEIDSTLIITVVVELPDRTRRAGSAVSEGGRAYGVARAAWSALTAQG